jgi:hypothetical protein
MGRKWWASAHGHHVPSRLFEWTHATWYILISLAATRGHSLLRRLTFLLLYTEIKASVHLSVPAFCDLVLELRMFFVPVAFCTTAASSRIAENEEYGSRTLVWLTSLSKGSTHTPTLLGFALYYSGCQYCCSVL